MKFLVLAAGYGTRLGRDIANDTSGKYAHLVGVPKPLVPVDGKPLLDHWVDNLLASNSNNDSLSNDDHDGDDGNNQIKISLDDIYLVTNDLHYPKFAEWAKTREFPLDNILNDGSTSNDSRLGAICDIHLMVQEKKIQDDLMIIGGDTLFFQDFSLRDIISTFNAREESLVLWYECADADTKKSGILVTNEDGLVTGFLEKPGPDTTTSRQACPCFYLYKAAVLKLLQQYIDQSTTLKQVDAPGNFLAWVYAHSPIWAYRISGRWDIGGLASYIETEEFYHKARAEKEAEQSTLTSNNSKI